MSVYSLHLLPELAALTLVECAPQPPPNAQCQTHSCLVAGVSPSPVKSKLYTKLSSSCH